MFKADLKSDTLKGLVNIISTLIDEGKGAFESYEAEACEIGLDLDKVKSVLKLAASGDIIKMEQDDTHGRLVFKVGNITRRMNLVDTASMNDPKVPQLSLATDISLKVDELQKGIRAAESISDHITLRAGVGYFELSCEGDTDSVSLRLEGDAIESINAESDVQSMFPLDYFSNIVKAIPAGTVVRVELDNDYPVKLVFALADGQVKVNYLLAPRIESD